MSANALFDLPNTSQPSQLCVKFPIMHKLETPWTCWVSEHHQGGRGRALSKDAYMRDMAKLCSIESVEEFWSFHATLCRPQDMRVGANIFLFRVGLKPLWEEMPNGATWSIKIHRSQHYDMTLALQKVLLLCIGESLDAPHLAGCSLSSRMNQFIISVWFDINPQPEEQFSILEKLKNILELPVDTVMEYKEHALAIIDGSSSAHARRYSITS